MASLAALGLLAGCLGRRRRTMIYLWARHATRAPPPPRPAPREEESEDDEEGVPAAYHGKVE